MENLENNTQELQAQEAPETETEEKLSFTKEELDDLLQKNGDARVTQALKTQAKKQEAKLREAEKLAKMSAEEKYVYELEQREKLIEQREAELALSENKNVCSKILADKGLSLSFVDFVVDSDADIMQERIKTIEKAFKASVRNEVEKRLAAKTPATSMAAFNGISKEQFQKMSLAQMQDLANSEPELYAALTK